MRKLGECVWGLGLAALLAAGATVDQAAIEVSKPKLDRPKLESYVRYTEGYLAKIKLTIDDPIASAFPGYYRVMVHLSLATDKGVQQVGEKMYYTPDGQHFLAGQFWQLGKNPFAEALETLPTAGPSFGPENAKVTVVVFSDFECPYCRDFARTMRTHIPQKFPNEVRVVFEDFPIESIHPWAFAAAEAGRCLANQSAAAFWAYHDWIFEHQGEVNAADLKEKTLALATEQKVSADTVGACMDSHAERAAVTESLRIGRQLQIQQTPTLFMNGRMIPGAVRAVDLDAVVELELHRPEDIAAPVNAKCCQVSAPTVLPR